MEQRRIKSAKRKLLLEPMVWDYIEPEEDRPHVVIEAILGERRVGKLREVLVRWEGGETTWEPRAIIAADVPAMWQEYQQKHGRRHRKLVDKPHQRGAKKTDTPPKKGPTTV